MASTVEGFGNQVWLVRGYDGLKPIFETRICCATWSADT
jgi:hypothetical protein